MATSITSLRNPIDDLTSKLNEPPTKPVGSIEEQLTSQRERGARAEELRPQVMKESLGSVETAMQDLQAKREAGAQDYGKMLEKQAKDTAALEEKYTAMRPEPIEFAPSQQTPEQLQTIAISMMLVGALAGGGAKRSGIAGLKAMTGMLDGYKQGRKDVFDREKIIFEKALETQKQKIEEVKSLYDSALRAQTAGQTAEANKFKALLEAEIQGGSMYVDIAKGRYDASNKMFDAATKAGGEATKAMIEINKAIEDRKMRREELAARRGEFKTIGVDENGNVVQINEAGTTRTVSGVKPATAGVGKVGQNNLMFAGRVHSNILGASKDLAGIASLPGAAQSPVLSGVINRDPETVLGSLTAAAARKMTAQDQRAFDQVANSLDLALTKIEGQGLASSATKFNVQQYSALRPRAGDRAINMAIYLAKVRQEIETGVLSHSRMAGATAEQRQDLQNVLKDVERTIPFTLDDVTDVLRRGRERLDEKTQRILGLPSVTEEAIRAGSGNLNADMPAITGQRPTSNRPSSGSQGASNVPDIDTWVAAAKTRNPNATDAELRAYWQNKYGASR